MATRKIVPRANGEGSLGDNTTGIEKYWGGVFANVLNGANAIELADFNDGLQLKRSTTYAVGQSVFTSGLEAGQFLMCLVNGITDSTAITIPGSITPDVTTIVDGTVTWIVRQLANTSDLLQKLREPSTAYLSGDIRYLKTLPCGWFLEVKTAGTTGSGALTINSPSVGDDVTDGTVTWTIKKTGSGSGGGEAVGIIKEFAGNGDIPAGYLLCDGAAYSRAMFPDLFAAIGTDYGSGDGSTTFNVPDYNTAARFAQGSTVAGVVKQAGLPNITGSTTQLHGNLTCRALVNSGEEATGAFTTEKTSGSYLLDSVSYSASNYLLKDTFDASQSNPIYGNSTTVQPNALTTRYIIKAFDGQTPDSALIDITQYASDLANKADRDLSNLTSTGLTKVLSTVSKAQNGYQVLGNGLIMQWGLTTAITYDHRLNVTFPIEFPNACVTAVANFVADATMVDHVECYGVANITKTSFDIENQYLISGFTGKNFPATWIAIGY